MSEKQSIELRTKFIYLKTGCNGGILVNTARKLLALVKHRIYSQTE